ncbi:host cell division inhibitor Icd-like protein, partial [Escherichia coli]|nr:host cell division inhibitor Icd-like protein [Escherichia coli]EKP1974217.1 host cell division inhibitor Icd-like protein [Escherichia coli]EKP8728829.1 host cell division inhibitor Icd-like protein [Escherichia coli]EKP8747991.1 host cell division inhibitor Icd-like protein [Escherichia coli]EKP9114123.1 host cell division inhibitor Icd-like protein [Escherichia coli]
MDKNMLIASSFGLYDAGVAHMATGFSSLNKLADSRPYPISGFFVSVNLPIPALWRGVTGEPLRSLVSQFASLLTLLRLATTFSSVVARLLNIKLGAFHMAVSARPYFVWRFMQCLTDSIAIFTVTAATEREARAQLPHAHLIF